MCPEQRRADRNCEQADAECRLAELRRSGGFGSEAATRCDRDLGAIRAARLGDKEETRDSRETEQAADVGAVPLSRGRERRKTSGAEHE